MTKAQGMLMDDGSSTGFNHYLYVGQVLAKTGLLHEIEKFLCYPGSRMFHVTGNTEARAIVENNPIAAIIVDQYLHDCSGLDFMHWLHNFAFIPTVVVVMNGFSRDTEMVVVLEAGAADAVHLEMSSREVAARVNACTRKYFYGKSELDLQPAGMAGRFARQRGKAPLYYSPESKRLYFSDTTRSILHGKEADLLTLLITRYPEYIDREAISQHLFSQAWNPNDRRIDNLVSKLRKIMDDSDIDGADSIIETVRNEGYRLRAPISLVPVDAAISMQHFGSNSFLSN